jgi:phosphate transport system permease protein
MTRVTGKDRAVEWVLRGLTYIIVAAVAYIILFIVWNGAGSLTWEFLTTAPRESGMKGGIMPAIVGTLLLVFGTMIIALPLGMACAVYLSEYAHQGRFTRAIRLAIVTLAGIPSIVFGLFGLGLFVIYFDFGTSILSGSLTLACMVLPTVIVASEESLRAVPRSQREGSLALGASQWYTISRNVLPYAVPGMVTGSVLAVGRAAGETAPIMLTAAALYLRQLPEGIFYPVMALPYHLYYLATQTPDAEAAAPAQYGTALVLLLLVLGVNLAAILLRYRFRKKYKW